MPLIRVEPTCASPAALSARAAGAGSSPSCPPTLRRVANKRSRHRDGRAKLEPLRERRVIAPPELTPALVQEAIAPHLTRQRCRRIERVLRQRLASVTVVLEHLYDPQNGAAVLRTCEALGLVQVHAIEGEASYYFSRKVSRGTHKWLNIYLHRSTRSCLEHLQRCGFVCWAALAPTRSAAPLAPQRPLLEASRPVALVFGNEHVGLSTEARAACDAPLEIPMQGFCESFNLSVSVALALYQAADLRRQYLGRPGDLRGELLARLRASYYAASTPHAAALVLERLRR